jgi:hypothetical protein
VTVVDLVTGMSTAAGAMANLTKHARTIWTALAAVRRNHPAVAYENLLIELVLDIRDRRGMRAVLERRQRVRFLAEEVDVVRELAWGDGEPFAHYRVRGATRLMVRPEGPKRAVLLGLQRRPTKDERVTLSSRRLIRGGFLEAREYWEVWFERPTRRVALTVIFPNRRPPHAVELVTLPRLAPPRRVPVRFAADGRAFVRWSETRLDLERTYSLRWSW